MFKNNFLCLDSKKSSTLWLLVEYLTCVMGSNKIFWGLVRNNFLGALVLKNLAEIRDASTQAISCPPYYIVYRKVSCFGTRQLFWDRHFLLISLVIIDFIHQLWVEKIPQISLHNQIVQHDTFDLFEDAVLPFCEAPYRWNHSFSLSFFWKRCKWHNTKRMTFFWSNGTFQVHCWLIMRSLSPLKLELVR